LPVVANLTTTLERDAPEWKPLLRHIRPPRATSKPQSWKPDGIGGRRAEIISPDRERLGIILPENALALAGRSDPKQEGEQYDCEIGSEDQAIKDHG
jgi:hypothetical protein